MIDKLFIDILLISAMCWWVVTFQPIQRLFEKLFKGWQNPFAQIVYKVVTCGLCFGFWGGLILTQSFPMACLISFTTEFLYKKTFFN